MTNNDRLHNAKIRVGIIGGAGYTAGELLRLLVNHRGVDIKWINSQSQAGRPVHEVHTGLLGETSLCFADTVELDNIDVLFMCSGHGESSRFWSEHTRPETLKVIDLAQDYRDEHDGYVYGLTDLKHQRIANASLIANPGCFATAIQLSLLPLADAGLLQDDIHITALTGSTGAGVKPSSTTHFSWRTDNISVYKPFTHQHLGEIKRTINRLQPDFKGEIHFVPMRGDFARGIFASTYTPVNLTDEQLSELYTRYYSNSPFTFVSPNPIDLKQAVNTNKAIIHVERHGKMAHITIAIDNLLKGASGQAVENLNLMFGFDPREGLALKPSAF